MGNDARTRGKPFQQARDEFLYRCYWQKKEYDRRIFNARARCVGVMNLQQVFDALFKRTLPGNLAQGPVLLVAGRSAPVDTSCLDKDSPISATKVQKYVIRGHRSELKQVMNQRKGRSKKWSKWSATRGNPY